MADEVGWLIEFEREATPVYYGKTEDGLHLTKDQTAAIRFCRREDAQAVIDDIGWTRAKPVEHMWCDAPCKRCGGTKVEPATAGNGHHWCPDCRGPKFLKGVLHNECENVDYEKQSSDAR